MIGINNELEIMDLMKNIEYGWVDKDNNKYADVNELFSKKYILQSPKDIIKNKIGVCWDQVELERHYFNSNDWNIKTFFLVHYDGNECPTHTFLTFEKNDKYYWFEHAWEKFRGIHEYTSERELLIDVKNKFLEHELNITMLVRIYLYIVIQDLIIISLYKSSLSIVNLENKSILVNFKQSNTCQFRKLGLKYGSKSLN